MKKSIYISSILLFCISLIACKPNYKPEDTISKEDAISLKYALSRYLCKMPNHATEDTKFNNQYDEAYYNNAQKLTLDKYFVGEKDTIFFEVTKLAPSVKRKYTATGGKMVIDASNKIIFYEEVYRTWKMEQELLSQRTPLFFEAMIEGKDLSPYYTENINSDTYIEFPNNFTKFDLNTRKWVFNQEMAYHR